MTGFLGSAFISEAYVHAGVLQMQQFRNFS